MFASPGWIDHNIVYLASGTAFAWFTIKIVVNISKTGIKG
jgi:hypothetical protein